jgi:hypothetical protein
MKRSMGLLAQVEFFTVGGGLFLGDWNAQWDLSEGVSSGSEGTFSCPKVTFATTSRAIGTNNPIFFRILEEIWSKQAKAIGLSLIIKVFGKLSR